MPSNCCPPSMPRRTWVKCSSALCANWQAWCNHRAPSSCSVLRWVFPCVANWLHAWQHCFNLVTAMLHSSTPCKPATTSSNWGQMRPSPLAPLHPHSHYCSTQSCMPHSVHTSLFITLFIIIITICNSLFSICLLFRYYSCPLSSFGIKQCEKILFQSEETPI